ncbi:hypothetical protein ABWJ92_32345 [Streptomyces sp. NPDC000609]|uniref:transposase n=1 Tax=Streptomyces sp. NPDC000609 TaxID=3160957 RepID=UPI003393858D
MSAHGIRSHPAGMYGVEVSPDLTSRAADAVTHELDASQNRPLDAVRPVIRKATTWMTVLARAP